MEENDSPYGMLCNELLTKMMSIRYDRMPFKPLTEEEQRRIYDGLCRMVDFDRETYEKCAKENNKGGCDVASEQYLKHSELLMYFSDAVTEGRSVREAFLGITLGAFEKAESDGKEQKQ